MEVYSYHTFIFPFLWNDGGKISRCDFEKCLNKEYWKDDVFGEYRVDNEAVKMENYSAYQYFNVAARSVIYSVSNDESRSVRCFRYAPELFSKFADADIKKREETREKAVASKKDGKRAEIGLNNSCSGVRYNIKARINVEKNKKEHYLYSLRVNGIRLKLYNTGIGMLVFELENDMYSSIEHVNRINDFGRRIFRPFYGEDGKCSVCADYLSIVGLPSGVVISSVSCADIPKDPCETKIPSIITCFLTNGDFKVTLDRKEKSRKTFFIESIIDDRMFVACAINDKSFVDSLSEIDIKGEYRYLSDAVDKSPSDKIDNVSRQLYETVFVDGDGSSCHDRRMLRKMLENHVYTRWIENYYQSSLSGTVYGISEYSLICISASSFPISAFLTEYTEIAMLVLVQRASLLAFERKISEVSSCGRGEKELQQQYIDFDSQFMLHEITAQQQGIEIYNMILQLMFVKEKKADVENQIRNLFELKNFKNDNTMNLILLVIAILGVVEFIGTVADWVGSIDADWVKIVAFGVSFILIILLYKFGIDRKK